MMALVLFLAIGIGLALGLLGGGGSVLAVPVLKYVAGLEAKEALATQLLIVGTTAGVGAIQHAFKGNIAFRTGTIFAATAMLGAYLGGLAAVWFSGRTLLILFAGMMLVTSVMMFRGRGELTPREGPIPVGLVMGEGLAVGFFTGLVGAGGGFMIVPVLVLMGGMPMHRAVGTSLMIMTLKSYSAFLGYVNHVQVDYELAGYVTLSAVFGTIIGAHYSQRINAPTLRKGFAWFVLSMAAFVLSQEANIWVAASVIIPAAAWMAYKTAQQRKAA
jgi:uncharacterized membrane protein YfcA